MMDKNVMTLSETAVKASSPQKTSNQKIKRVSDITNIQPRSTDKKLTEV